MAMDLHSLLVKKSGMYVRNLVCSLKLYAFCIYMHFFRSIKINYDVKQSSNIMIFVVTDHYIDCLVTPQNC